MSAIFHSWRNGDGDEDEDDFVGGKSKKSTQKQKKNLSNQRSLIIIIKQQTFMALKHESGTENGKKTAGKMLVFEIR